MSQEGELATFHHPAVILQQGSDVEVWTQDANGEPKQLMVIPAPKFRVDCSCAQPMCDCVRAAIAQVLPIPQADPIERVRQKLRRG